MKIQQIGPQGITSSHFDDLTEFSLGSEDLSDIEPVPEANDESPSHHTLDDETRTGVARVISLIQEAQKRLSRKLANPKLRKLERYQRILNFESDQSCVGASFDKKI